MKNVLNKLTLVLSGAAAAALLTGCASLCGKGCCGKGGTCDKPAAAAPAAAAPAAK